MCVHFTALLCVTWLIHFCRDYRKLFFFFFFLGFPHLEDPFVDKSHGHHRSRVCSMGLSCKSYIRNMDTPPRVGKSSVRLPVRDAD